MSAGTTPLSRPRPQRRGPASEATPAAGDGVTRPIDRIELLRRFLEVYWLRPENALWMTLRSLTLAACPFRRPSIDLSCGDGLFSFLHAGGILDPCFDVFTSIQNPEGDEARSFDMFDRCDDNYAPPVRGRPGNHIDIGTDWKPALLAKAAKLDFYQRLVQQDHNKKLAFEDATFGTVFGNAAYWVESIDLFLSELARIARPGGRVILQVKLSNIRQCTLTAHKALLGARFLEILDRGRVDSWPTLADRSTWERRFQRANLAVVSVRDVATRTHAHLWDVGLRPLAPVLIRLANAAPTPERSAIKRDWVDCALELLSPLCDPTVDLLPGSAEPVELQYELQLR